MGKTTEESSSTFNFTVYDDDGNHVPLQIEAAEGFLVENSELLRSLMADDSVEFAMLDFAWCVPRDSLASFNRFPPPFLGHCAELNIHLEISLYLSAREKADFEEDEMAVLHKDWLVRHEACKRCHGELEELCICGPEPCRECGDTELALLAGSMCPDCVEDC
ncbi:MAG: hypothetical protein P1V97_29065 [Planctomycetota bacterium]|nr:hypothetical protein [Planctomycetota bacterium]